MRPVSAAQAHTVEELRTTGQKCSAHGAQYVEAGSPVAAREWFDAATSAFRAAYELERRDQCSISGGMENR